MDKIFTMTEAIKSITEIIDLFDAFFIDQYGVIHNGSNPHFGAVQALRTLKAHDKQVIMISNSGRVASYNKRLMENMGIPCEYIDHILTSGDSSLSIMKQLLINNPSLSRCYPICNDQDYSHLIDLGLEITMSPSDADVIFLAGIDLWDNDVESFRSDLEILYKNGAILVCANPDIHCVVRGGLRDGPGKVARLFEKMGGEVIYIGKPHKPIFEYAYSLLKNNVSRSRVVMVGDSLEHDINGGNNSNFKTLLIACGIHQQNLGLSIDPIVAPPPINYELLVRNCQDFSSSQNLTAPDFVAPLFM